MIEDSRWRQQLVDAQEGYEDETFNRYAHRLLRLAESRLPDQLRRRVDAADIVQSALRSFFSRHEAGEFQFPQTADIWRLLATITYRKIQQAIRFHHRQCRDAKLECDQSGVVGVQELESPTASSVIAFHEIIELILQQLPATHQDVFRLRMQGATIQEIADQLNISTRTVNRGIALVQKIGTDLMVDP